MLEVLDVNNYGLQSMVGAGKMQDKTATPTTSQQVIEPDQGYDGMSSVTVGAVTSSIDNNIVAGNIKKDVSILGVTGTYEGTKAVLPDGIKFQSSTTSNMDFLNNVDSSNVINMNRMFYGCTKLTTLDLSSFNTSNVTDMSSMFNSCEKLTSLDLSNFDTRNVTNMSNMFNSCNELTTLDLSSFDTRNVTNMSNMFKSCNELTTLDLSNFDTRNVTNMSNMFSSCYELTTLDLSSFDFLSVTSRSSIFGGVPTTCTIYVKDQNTVDLLTSWDNTHTYTIKTV